jgi:hypothetical protein
VNTIALARICVSDYVGWAIFSVDVERLQAYFLHPLGAADSAMPDLPNHPYERKIVEHSDNLLIESRCALCGFRIVGSVTDGLLRDEQDHSDRCPNRIARAATPDGKSH